MITKTNIKDNPGIETSSIPRECKALKCFLKIEADSCNWLSDASHKQTVMDFR